MGLRVQKKSFPYISDYRGLAMQISTSIKQCYFSANSRIMFSSLPILKSIYKVGLAIFKSRSEV